MRSHCGTVAKAYYGSYLKDFRKLEGKPENPEPTLGEREITEKHPTRQYCLYKWLHKRSTRNIQYTHQKFSDTFSLQSLSTL